MSLNKKHKTSLVLGAGAFATSMAKVIADNFEKVIVKVRNKDAYDSFLEGENKTYLPGIKLPQNIIPALTFDEVIHQGEDGIELVVSGLPTSAIHEYSENYYGHLKRFLNKGIPFVSLSKGIDATSLKLPDQLFKEHFNLYKDQFCYLSGPSFAKEILEEQITLVSLAGSSRESLMTSAQMLSTDYFKVFPTYDIKGTLLGGALKNVLAIAGGIVEGLGYNHNTRAALITTGIHDMMTIGKVYSARSETFYGLGGMGDLILTMTGDLSRNKWFGGEVAKAQQSVEEILSSRNSVVEGYLTTKAVYLLTKKFNLNCPIFDGVYRILYEEASPKQVIADLMGLSSKIRSI